MPTGEIEIDARELRVLNEAKVPPFQIADDAPVSDDLRLKYRYLDLRRPRLAANLRLRLSHRHDGPALLRRPGLPRGRDADPQADTPEGARDYLVPSRVQPARSTPCRSRRSSTSRS